jgi:hypothetical protein
MRMVELTAIDHKNQREMHLTGVLRVSVITTKSGYLCYNVTFVHAGGYLPHQHFYLYLG